MKKTLLLLSTAALLLAGCAKEKFAEPSVGGLTNATFTASVDGGVATKAVADNDGNGAFVNRCIMEIYFQNELYKRLVESTTSGVATFANVPVVAGKEYKILFWADCGGEELADKYYTTTDLKTVTVAKEAFIAALKAGDNDKLDAFFFADNYNVPQAGGNYAATLKRPFAQLNVITTDVGEGKTVTSADLLPEKVSVSYTAANAINVATGEVSGTETYAYEAPVYGVWSTVATSHELTLSMDYILASTEQGAVDVTFKTKNGGNVVMSHNLTNLPYQRNYRTNVKGALLTVGGNWTATIDPIWNQPDIVKVVEVADIKSANEIIKEYAATTDNLEVKFVGVPNDSGEPSGEPESQFRAILTSPLKQDANLGIEVMTNTKTLYVGDYKVEYCVAELAAATELKAATVNINVPQNSGIETLVINAPTKTVLINGKLVDNVGTITNIDAITSQNTLIIEPGQQVTKLTMRQGGLEIHGTVGTLVIDQTDATNNPVKVRTSENLNQTVFDVIYKEGEHDYIDRPAYSEKKNADGTWNIVPSVCKITETGKAYGSVADAFAVVENGQTIVMLQNDVLTKGQTLALEDNEAFTLDLNGKTISIAETGFDFTANGTNVALRNGVPVRFAIVVNGVGTMNICDNSTTQLGRIETKNNSYGTTKTILVDGNAVVNINSGTVAADYAAFYVVGYTATGAVPANAPKPTLNVNGGKIIGQQLGIGIKGNTATLKVTGGEIVGEETYGVSTNGTQDWYDGGKFAIEITGGLIKSVDGNAMYLPAEGPTVITGGTIEGATGIAVKGGSLSISDNAIVKATGPFVEAHEVSSGNANTGSAIYVEDTYPNHAPLVNISGGKFSSENNKAVEYFTNKAEEAADKGKITLTGGIYSDKPAEVFVANHYIVTANDDATYPWKVELSPEAVSVARIGTTEYYSLSDALSAAKEGEAVYIIPTQLKETVNASNDNNIQLILDGKNIIGDITFGGKGTLIVRAEELNKDYYSYPKAYEVDAPTIPAQGVGGIMGKISATGDATVMLRENLYSGPFVGNVELRGGFYYSGLGLDNIQAQTPNGIGLVVDEIKNVQGYDMYYVPEVPESYLVHIQNVLELLAAYKEGKVSDEQINQITLGYGLGERILQPWWLSVDGGDASLIPSGDNYFPNDVYAFFTNLKDGEYDNPKYAYQDWYCDYLISYSKPIKKDYQSGIWGYYGNMSIGCWLPSSVTQTPFAMLSAVNMKRTYSQMLSDVGMFLCGPVNLNPDDAGTVITVHLNIYPDSETDKCITTNKVVYTIPAISE